MCKRCWACCHFDVPIDELPCRNCYDRVLWKEKNKIQGVIPSPNSAMDAIALANEFHSTLDLGKMELERVTIQRFMIFVQEQLPHGADVVKHGVKGINL